MSIQQNMTTMSTYLDALTDGEQEAANYVRIDISADTFLVLYWRSYFSL
jgi:hypothetical protein